MGSCAPVLTGRERGISDQGRDGVLGSSTERERGGLVNRAEMGSWAPVLRGREKWISGDN